MSDPLAAFAFHLAVASITTSLDHLRTVAQVVQTALIPAFALMSLLRTGHECALVGEWLLEPSITDEQRIARGVGAQISDYDERRKFEDAIGRPPPARGQLATERLSALLRDASSSRLHEGQRERYAGRHRTTAIDHRSLRPIRDDDRTNRLLALPLLLRIRTRKAVGHNTRRPTARPERSTRTHRRPRRRQRCRNHHDDDPRYRCGAPRGVVLYRSSQHQLAGQLTYASAQNVGAERRRASDREHTQNGASAPVRSWRPSSTCMRFRGDRDEDRADHGDR